MANNSCILNPEAPNGDDSRLYRDLLKIIKDRPITNYFYASYLAADKTVANAMDNAGYDKNSQGEHNAADLLKFLDFNKIQEDMTHLPTAELQLGSVDSNGQRVDFTNAEDALRKADDFNKKHKGLVANVIQHGDVYNIIVAEKSSNTVSYTDNVRERLQVWDAYKQAFNYVGVDISSMPQELQSVFNAMHSGLAQYLKNLEFTTPDNLYKRDAMVLFSLSPNTPKVQRAVNAFGSIEAAAQALDDFNHGSIDLTVPQQRLLLNAINEAKQFQGINMDVVIAQVKQLGADIASASTEKPIKDKLRELNKKYHLDAKELHRTGDTIKFLSDAASEAAVVLKRQIRKLEKERGNNAEGKKLEDVLNNLMKELAAKKYYSGILAFLSEASSQISSIDAMMENIPQTGTELEKAFAAAKVLQSIKSLKEQYYLLVSALANKSLLIDESISQSDIDNIRKLAADLKEFFDRKDSVINDRTKETMKVLLTAIMGSTAPDGQAISNVVEMAAADSSITNYLYSVGRASNPVVAAMGSVIRNAQDSRNGKMNAISLRIRRATNRLYKAGFNSEFMYEDDGHIISDIDWGLYAAARKAAIKYFASQGLKGFDLKQAIEDWEDQNTEDRIVDSSNGRTEKIPNSQYRKTENFKKDWSKEQIEYYDTMMQLKGEIGSLLPFYAQQQYLPPQLRRKFLDALHDAKSLKDVGKAVKNKLENLYTVREDDENYNSNGIIDGDEFTAAESDFDNTPLRQIPIFFVNKVEDGELLRNFSTGLQALAGTAINYNVMNEVVDVVELMEDFVKNQHTRDKKSKASIIQTRDVRIIKDMWKKAANSNTNAMVEGMVSQHVYGKKREDIESKWGKAALKVFDNIVSYTSFKSLVTNFKGMFQNGIMGEFQMLVDVGCGEYYGLKDYIWAHAKLFGSAGVGGEIMELLTNNINHKSVLFREKFDPMSEDFSQKSHTKYYKSWFRQLIAHDCSFIGYSSGEFLIHYVNMYALLHNKKNNVFLNGKEISLYDAYEVVNKQDGNSELKLKEGVTDRYGNPITPEFEKKIKGKIKYLNDTCHGAMNEEDKGIIHQKWWGRGIMNFRQWMPEHYSRRFRAAHFDASLGEVREGYWVSFYKGIMNEDTKDTWNHDQKMKAMGMFIKDLSTFLFRADTNWKNLSDMQKYNIKRVRSEMAMYICLLGLGFALGEPDEHKKEFWRRWWIYQTKRLILDTEAAMPHPRNLTNFQTMLQSPMASVPTMSALMYAFYGLFNGDLFDEIKSGDHKGENRYWRNIKKYDLPFFKDIEQMQKMDTDDAIFKVFEDSPRSN